MLEAVPEGALMLRLIAVALTLARTNVFLTAYSSERERNSQLPAVTASEELALTRHWPEHHCQLLKFAQTQSYLPDTDEQTRTNHRRPPPVSKCGGFVV
jgi:hypothetical protein